MKKEKITLAKDIISSDLDTRKKLLKDKEIRDELLNDERYYDFFHLVEFLTETDIDYFLDDDMINRILKNNSKLTKLDAFLNNHYSSKFLSHGTIFEYLLENYDCFNSLDYEFGISLFNYILKNPKYIKSISYLNSDVQYQIFSNKTLRKKLINLNIKENYLYLLDRKVITILLEEKYYQNMFLNSNIDIIHSYIKENDNIPTNILCKELIDKYTNIKDINKYRNYLEEINNITLKNMITKQRKKYYIKTINETKEELLPFYYSIYEKIINKEDYKNIIKEDPYYFYNIDKIINNKSLLKKYLKELSTKRMLEITIDMYFEDISYNFLKNIYSILQYICLIDKVIIPKENLSIYLKFINYYNMSTKEQIELFNNLNNGKDYVSMFYDDFMTVKKHSYENINNSVINLNNLKSPDSFNNNIYELNGEDFYILVHHTTFDKKIGGKWDIPSDTLSLSLISHNNMNTFRNPHKNIILGFNIDTSNIIHLYESDSFSEELESSTRIQRLLTKEELINRTKGYNEIVVRNKNFDGKYSLFPSYVVCYDFIGNGDLNFSKMYNIPILLIHTDKYSLKDREMIDAVGDNYMSGYSASYIDVDTYKKMS